MGIHPSITDTPEVKKLKKENEQLVKEKEWLLNRCAEDKAKASLYLTSEYTKLLIEQMQQELKEK